MSKSTLSVVIPTYNRCDSLAKTLAGLKNQSYPSQLFEVVIVSDGSTDGTDQMVAEYAEKRQFQIRFFQQQNSGPSRARNKAIAESINDVIVFVDDDVEPIPEFLAAHARWHEENDRIAVIGPLSPDPLCHSSEPCWITWEHDKLKRIYGLFQPGGAYVHTEAGPNHFYSGNASVKRKWLNSVGGFDLRYTRQEDVELATRLQAECGIEFKYDFTAIGIHRPSRTFESWVKIPSAYGRLDAQRVADGTISLQSITEITQSRHILTHAAATVAQSGSGMFEFVSTALRIAALSASALGQERSALIVLSALYNVTYLTEFQRESHRLSQEVLAGKAENRA